MERLTKNTPKNNEVRIDVLYLAFAIFIMIHLLGWIFAMSLHPLILLISTEAVNFIVCIIATILIMNKILQGKFTLRSPK